MYRLAILASHPIQYQIPIFRELASHPEIDLHVLFFRRLGVEPYRDPGFQVTFSWDIPLLKGYRSSFLRNLSPCPDPSSFFSALNPGIVTALKPSRFDAIWIHGWDLVTTWIGWATAILWGLPILLRVETNGLTEPKGLRRMEKELVLKALFRRIDGFLAIGTCNVNFYRSYGVPPEKIFWAPYAVDNAFFMEKAVQLFGQKHSLREKEGIPRDAPVILFVGKFVERKRPMDLLKAFALLSRQFAATLVFVGEGPLRPTMERFVAKDRLKGVTFLGFRNQTQMPACYAMADVLVLPSEIEPWGLVLNEAMCFGLPVIASNRVGAAADLVRDGINGFTYPVGDSETLAERLRRVLQDEHVRRQMGEQSLQMINRWGVKEGVNGILRCLNSIVR